MPSESGAIIARLIARGMTGEAIGQAIDRDRSLVSQVNRGVKPGDNLRASLEAVEARLQGAPAVVVPEPPRRLTRTGREARVRTPTTITGRRGDWSTSTVKRQGAASGARSLAKRIEAAADDGASIAVTITYAKSVNVLRAYGKRGRAGYGGVVELRLEPDDYEGGSVVDWINGEAVRGAFIASPSSAIESLELRVF